MTKFSASIQVGGKFKARMYEVLGSGRFFCEIYGQVQNHWGQIAVQGATYTVDTVSAETLEGLRAACRARIDGLGAGGSLLFRCDSRAMFDRCYLRVAA